MKYLFIALASISAIIAIDRVLLWCERRGWIYWRKASRRRAGSSVFLQLETFYQPEKRHMIELSQEQEIHREEDDEGGKGEEGSTEGDPDERRG